MNPATYAIGDRVVIRFGWNGRQVAEIIAVQTDLPLRYRVRKYRHRSRAWTGSRPIMPGEVLCLATPDDLRRVGLA
jgi:hypothetical protein